MLATTGVESLNDYVARYLPQLVLSVVIPLMMVGLSVHRRPDQRLIVAVTLPLIPLFMALVGWYTDSARPAASGRACPGWPGISPTSLPGCRR